MKKTMAVVSVALFLAAVLAPSVTLAAWWNPFTWGVFNRGPVAVVRQVAFATSTKAVITATSSAKVTAKSPIKAPAQKTTADTSSTAPISADTSAGKLTVSILDPKYQEQYQIKLATMTGEFYTLATVVGKSGAVQTETVTIPAGISSGTYYMQVTQITNAGRCPNDVCAVGRSNPFGISSLGTYAPKIDPIILVQASAASSPSASVQPTASATQLNRDIGVGDSGEDVKLLQAFLLARGYLDQSSNPISGSFGTLTQLAVSKYQSSIGIPATGYVGPSTRASINASVPSMQTTIQTLIINQTNTFNQTNQTINQTVIIAPMVSKPVSTPVPVAEIPFSLAFTANGQNTATIGQAGPSNNPFQSVTLAYKAQGTRARDCTRSGPSSYWEKAAQAPVNSTIEISSDSLPVGDNIFTVTCYDTAGNSLTDSVTVKVNPLPIISCPQNTSLNGVTYSLEPCSIDMTMVDGQGDRGFSTTITPSVATSSYSFQIYGYGVGLPTYGILGTASGGAWGNTTIDDHFSDKVLSSNGTQPRVYSGYLPIDVIDDKGNSGHLYLRINLTVNPAQ